MRIRIQLVLLSLLPLVLTACGNIVDANRSRSEESEKSREIIFPVEAIHPARADLSSFIQTTATVQAENKVEITAKGSGQVLEVFVEEGDRVRSGQVLAELDKAELEAQIRQTRVNVQQQKAAYDVAEQSLQEGIGSRVERDNARFSYESVVANLELQQVQLGHQTIRSPIDGIVTHRLIQRGMLVSAGMPAFTVVDPRSYVLPIYPPEKDLATLRIGQVARVSVDSVPGEAFEAKIARINPSVELGGTVKVTLEFEPNDREKLRDGIFARVWLVTETLEDVLTINRDTLIEENTRTYLMLAKEDPNIEDQEEGEEPVDVETGLLVNGGTGMASTGKARRMVAQRVEVETGLEDGNLVEIRSGVSEDDLVITLGQHALRTGAPVMVTTTRERVGQTAGISAAEALEATASENSRQDQRHR